MVVGLLIAGCTPTPGPEPVLVTLPASTPGPITPTPEPPTPTEIPPTFAPTEPPPPTPLPESAGIGATRLLWEWAETARPSAAAYAAERLAVIVADGHFTWLRADTGRPEVTNFLWPSPARGDSWGEVYADLGVAVAALRETSINEESGLPETRARLVVFDAQGEELWALPELGTQHFYSAALTSGSVLVGTYHGFGENTLGAYELFTGNELWSISSEEASFRHIVHDGTRMYVLVNDAEGGGVLCMDLRTGDELWRWSAPDVVQPDLIALGIDHVYVLSVNATYALETTGGAVTWTLPFDIAPEAGLATSGPLIYMAPAPSVGLGFRPGLVGVDAATGGLAWHTLSGLLAEPLVVGDGVVWTIVKDYDAGTVALSGLEADTGLERVRLSLNDSVDIEYNLVTTTRRVYVLGNSLWAFGYAD